MKNQDQHFRNLVAIVATRNINNGEGILVEYGDEYGFHESEKKYKKENIEEIKVTNPLKSNGIINILYFIKY